MGQDNHMVTYPIERNFFGLKIFFCSGPPESQDCRPDAVLEASAIRSAAAKNALREALQNALGAPLWSKPNWQRTSVDSEDVESWPKQILKLLNTRSIDHEQRTGKEQPGHCINWAMGGHGTVHVVDVGLVVVPGIRLAGEKAPSPVKQVLGWT